MAKIVGVKAHLKKKKKGGVSTVKAHTKKVKDAKPKAPKKKKPTRYIDSSDPRFNLKHLGEGKPILIIDKATGKMVASADTQGMAANYLKNPDNFLDRKAARLDLKNWRIHQKAKGASIDRTPIQDTWHRKGK